MFISQFSPFRLQRDRFYSVFSFISIAVKYIFLWISPSGHRANKRYFSRNHVKPVLLANICDLSIFCSSFQDRRNESSILLVPFVCEQSVSATISIQFIGLEKQTPQTPITVIRINLHQLTYRFPLFSPTKPRGRVENDLGKGKKSIYNDNSSGRYSSDR